MNNNELIGIKLAGVSHNNAQAVIQQIVLEAGVDDFQLTREPNNEFDPNAVRVDCSTMFVGYIPKERSAKVAQIMDAGTTLVGRFSRVKQSPVHEILELTINIVEVQGT